MTSARGLTAVDVRESASCSECQQLTSTWCIKCALASSTRNACLSVTSHFVRRPPNRDSQYKPFRVGQRPSAQTPKRYTQAALRSTDHSTQPTFTFLHLKDKPPNHRAESRDNELRLTKMETHLPVPKSRVCLPGSVTLCSDSSTAAGLEAAYKVLNTVELLENVLSFLYIEDLFAVQLTCRGFASLLDTSPALRCTQFLGPELDASPQLLVGTRGLFWNEHSPVTARIAQLVLPSSRMKMTLNMKFISRRSCIVERLVYPINNYVATGSMHYTFVERDHLIDGRSSMEARLITQPPMTKVSLAVGCRCAFQKGLLHYSSKERALSQSEKGITFGVLFAKYRELLAAVVAAKRCKCITFHLNFDGIVSARSGSQDSATVE